MKTALRIRQFHLVKSVALLALFFVVGLSSLPLRADTGGPRIEVGCGAGRAR